MAHIVVIVGHARRDTYCDALAAAYTRGAVAAGHEVAVFHTASMAFDPVLRGAYCELQPLEPDLVEVRDALAACQHMVLIFPLWLGTLPGIFKGFLERILQPEIFEPAKTGKFAVPWKGKSARVVITMGMPAFIYRWYFGAHALKTLKRHILGFVGVAPIRSTLLGHVTGVSVAQRQRWLADMEALGRAAR